MSICWSYGTYSRDPAKIQPLCYTLRPLCGITVYLKPRLHSDPVVEDLKKLQVTQNKMFRLLDGKSKKDRVKVQKIATKFGLMSINQMTCYHYLMETYKIIHFGASDKLRKKLVPNSKFSKNLHVPLVKKTSCRGFTYYAARLWNSLPPTTKMREKPHQNVQVDRQRLRMLSKLKLRTGSSRVVSPSNSDPRKL